MKKITILFFTLSILLLINKSFSQGKLTPELLWKLSRVSEPQLSPDGNTVLYGITKYSISENKGNRELFTVSISGGNPKQLTESKYNEFNAIWRPDGKKIAYLCSEGGDVQFWEMNPDGTDKKKITNIPDGINGFSYAKSMSAIVFIKDVKLDKMVNEIYPDLPLANARIIDDLMYRHWDNWHDYAYSHIFYATYKDGSIGNITDIMENQRYDAPLTPDGGMEQISISPDGNKIAYVCKPLIGKEDAISTNSDIFVYDIGSKAVLNISKEILGYDKDPVFSNDGKMIVWQSMKTPGFESDKQRMMLYNFETKKAIDLSAKFDQNCANFVWSGDNKYIYFISGINATYQVYKVDVSTNKIEQLTNGWHDYTSLTMTGNKLVGSKMSISMPTELYSIDVTNGKENQITYTNKELLSTIEMGKVEERWVKTTDGKKMLVWVIKPPQFDSKKKYPAILYCQGGPQSAVSQFFSYRWNFQMMAANDYVVIAPNRRGLPTFGQEWNDQISLDYGGQNMKDYFSASDSISKESFVDANRIGVVGASYGGFSVYWLAGNHQNRYKTFIAHCGMFNLESWYGSTEEYWFANHDLGGAYWDKNRPKSYDFSPHKFVGNWDRPIMVIHGGKDFRIPETQGMEAFNAAQLKGIPSRFLYFPEETHFVLKPQNSILWQRVFFEWLDKSLK